ncbi:glycosyl transferase [Actinoplanes sp. ATCC 53533]|uniref:glycosyltransferase family 2 protein n=1 Tax=Actinoplanes sp. ATCC 53533 TaxID=1288362 RepID=UPI000F79091E|nr:glycosyltransferase [Actinoplanes sp. ATCC 53533]RSM65205.1 glycosyl transferase [Actinoplanes sp. ATCC 53533]
MSGPDVSVVVAVYNTMPYLTECLRSLVGQSIGTDRMEIVAVDDGSTDGSGAELDRWAKKHPRTVKVLHQENSGGPAGPSNRALDVATGRYVFFVGADDYLGTEALERLVATADELAADIVLGRLVGAGGRGVNQAVYTPGNRDDITLVNSALPWALSNTKLFRRSLLEEHQIRYPEELRSGSDQPFTIRAVVAARRIAVRADYEFYYAVRREDSSNITYRTSLYSFVQDTALIMDTAADLITDPAARERVLHRHFTWELGKLLGTRFLEADRDEQRRVQEGVRKLAETYLTDSIRASLEVQRRVPLSVAQYGTLDDLRAVARHYADQGLTPVITEGERHFIGFPGFRDPARGFPDDWFDGTEQVRERVHQSGPATVRWGHAPDGRQALLVGWHSTLPNLNREGEPPPRVFAGDRPAARTDSGDEGQAGTAILGYLVLDEMVAGQRKQRQRRTVKFTWTDLGETHSVPVTAFDLSAAPRILHRRGLRFHLVGVEVDEKTNLRVVSTIVTPRRIAGRLVRRLRRKR